MLYVSHTEYSFFYVVVRENKVLLRTKRKWNHVARSWNVGTEDHAINTVKICKV
jgi:hypothetical protein